MKKVDKRKYHSEQSFIESLVLNPDEERKRQVGFLISDVFLELKRLVEGLEKQDLTSEEFFGIMINIPINFEAAHIQMIGDPTWPAWDLFEENFIMKPKKKSVYHPSSKRRSDLKVRIKK